MSFYNLSRVERGRKRRFTRAKEKLPSLSEQIDNNSRKKKSSEKEDQGGETTLYYILKDILNLQHLK